MVFRIAPRSQVKDTFPEFREILPDLEDAAKSRAQEIWSGFEFGGVRPGNREFGLTTHLPRDFAIEEGSNSWVQNFGSEGSWADVFNYSVPEDEIHAFAGFSIPEPTLPFTQLRLEIGDRRFPIINIEEAQGFEDGFDLILKEDRGEELVVPEETDVLVRAFQERNTGRRDVRVVPLGFTLFRRKNLVINE